MVVIYCYLEREYYEHLEFHMNYSLLGNKNLLLLKATLQEASHLNKSLKLSKHLGHLLDYGIIILI